MIQIRLLAALSIATLAGCGESPPPPTIVNLHFSTSGTVNADLANRPSSIVVRYYLLARTGAFDRADYFALHDHEAALLGADLVDQEEVLLGPGTTKDVTVGVKPNGAFLGVTAAFRDIDHATWKADLPILPQQTNNFAVRLADIHLTVTRTTP